MTRGRAKGQHCRYVFIDVKYFSHTNLSVLKLASSYLHIIVGYVKKSPEPFYLNLFVTDCSWGISFEF